MNTPKLLLNKQFASSRALKLQYHLMNYKWPLMLLGSMLLMFLSAGQAFATTTPPSLASITSNISKSIYDISKILSDVSLVAGIGFVMASFFKFHQHKLNPTQVPISHGLTLILIGAGLLFFPYLLPIATKAVFGASQSINQLNGSVIGGIIGAPTGS